MRIVESLSRVLLIGVGLAAAPVGMPAWAFDGSRSDDAMTTPMAAVPLTAPLASAGEPTMTPPGLVPPGLIPQRSLPPPIAPENLGPQSLVAPDLAPPHAGPETAMEAFRSGAHWLKLGEKHKAVISLEYAAENGHPLAQWKLGRMYQEGDGVTRNDLKAFEYYRRIADSHADDNPDTPQARFVANAFVALGHYYLDGIPKTAIKRDPERAREMFSYAASYFRDPDAQYYLARLYLDGVGAPHDPRQAARWFGLSAQKGQCAAQAMLGAMLFAGDHVPRQAARGLMWLALAKANARADEQDWINQLYDSAMRQASEDERALGGVYLKHWMETRRE